MVLSAIVIVNGTIGLMNLVIFILMVMVNHVNP